jgi:uncharacterized protein YqhQ
MQVGGQAVLEGVMMRAPGAVATAVRCADGEIVIRKDPFISLTDTSRLCKLPVVRGAVGLVEMLLLGIRMLNFSAEVALRSTDSLKGQNSSGGNGQGRLHGKKEHAFALAVTIAASIAIGLAIFFVTPLVVATAFFQVAQDPLRFNLLAGAIRIVLFLGYLGGISSLKDIQRLFAYHGAEHKVVFAFERGVPLNVANAALQSRYHPRCGTSFILIVLVAAIALFSLLDSLVVMWLGNITLLTRLVTHLPLIPLVGGISYELIKVSAKHSNAPLGRAIAAPGLWLQRLTTREPDERQLEVALVALRSALGVGLEREGTSQLLVVGEISQN